jgi:hypothetical protein
MSTHVILLGVNVLYYAVWALLDLDVNLRSVNSDDTEGKYDHAPDEE